MRGCYLQFLLLLLGALLSCTTTETRFSYDLHYSKLKCIDEERQALLQFKQHLVDRFHWLSSWDVSYEDCCKWKGIQCSNRTGHVVKLDLQGNFRYGEPKPKYVEGEISSSLLGLQYLTYLDLSFNKFSAKPFPTFVGSLSKLKYLNLSNTALTGTIPQQLGNLSGLVSLDLSWNSDLMEAHNLDWLIHLSSLTHLDMSGVNLSQVLNWPNKLMMLPSLMYLSLSECSLIFTTSPQLLSINSNSSSRLLFLDLSLNIYPKCSVFPWLFNSTTSLVDLNLYGCQLQCSIPDAFGSINSLRRLDLSENELVGSIPKSFSNLCTLNSLSLSYNKLGGNLFEFVSNVSGCLVDSLQDFQIRGNSFTGPLPESIGNLSGLITLDLGRNNDLIAANNLDWLIHLSSLTHLDMSGVNLSQVLNWPNKVMMLPSLTYLSLRNCSLVFTKTPKLLSINSNSSSRLLFLDLSLNIYPNCSVFPWLFNSTTSLVDLNLYRCQLQCSIPDAFGSINSLRRLDLSENELVGSISKSFSNLCTLNSLSLSYNKLGGNLFEFVSNVSGCLVDSLQDFQIRGNSFTGPLPESIGNLSGLITLDLGWNNDLIEANNLDWLIHLSSLSHLDMSEVNLSQVLNWPNKVMMLASLTYLSLHNCSLVSTMTPQLLPINPNYTSRLQFLDLSFNNYLNCSIFPWLFNFTTSLVDLYLHDCGLQCSIPDAFGSRNSLRALDLSRNHLHGGIPKLSLSNLEILDVSYNYLTGLISEAHFSSLGSLSYLDMSNNQLHGNLPDLSSSRLADYVYMDLSSNLFYGSIPPFPLNVGGLDLSNNRFSGPISILCKFRITYFLDVLNLANNTLSGELPDCWTYFRLLSVLNLANNNIYGKIPNSMGSLASLEFLHLNNNGIIGKIPMSLQNCSMLKTIDLGTNNLFGMVPAWLGDSLPNLVVLSIRSNRFYGGLPLNLCRLSYIQILDLSSNQIEGTIPECIYNLTAMSDLSKNQDSIYMQVYSSNSSGLYEDRASLVWKGREFVFKASLVLVKMIDLSNNKLHGVVPEGITNLTELLALNLSRNNLIGLIPMKIGLLRNLQSLDLSRNQLCGEIPMSISNLNFLSQLDLSGNNLSGKIPTGTQIQSFDAYAFMGNSRLCGSPLRTKCPEDLINTQGDKNKNVRTNDDDGFITKGFYIAATLGFIGGFWGVCIILLLNIQYIMKRLTSNARMILA